MSGGERLLLDITENAVDVRGAALLERRLELAREVPDARYVRLHVDRLRLCGQCGQPLRRPRRSARHAPGVSVSRRRMYTGVT